MSSYLVNNQKGMTLVEVLIAVGLSSFVGILIFSMAYKPFNMLEDVDEKLGSRIQFELKRRQFIKHLARTHVMRRGFFSCGDPDTEDFYKILYWPNHVNLANGEDPGPVPTQAEITEFTIATSHLSSLGGVVEPALGDPPSQISVTDVTQFPAGSVILVSPINLPNHAALFRVILSDPATSTITISEDLTADFKKPTEFDCTPNADIVRSFSYFLDSDENHSFGKHSKVFRIDAIQFVKYTPEKDLHNSQKLIQKTWPVLPALKGEFDSADEPEEGFIKSALITLNYKSVELKEVTWTPNSDQDLRNGLFLARLELNLSERLLSSNPKSNNKIEKQIGSFVRYSTQTGGQINFGAPDTQVIPPPDKPTCSIVAKPAIDIVHYDNGNFGRFYQISVKASGGKVGSIAVNIADPPTSPVNTRCWRADTMNETVATPLNPGPTGLEANSADSPQSLIKIATTGTGALSKFYCDVAPGSSFSGTFNFFNASIGVMDSAICSSVNPVAEPAPVYEYAGGSESTCCRDKGSIDFGEVIKAKSDPADPTEIGPSLYVDGTSCQWSGSANTSCTPPDPNDDWGTLESVQLKPSNIPNISLNISCDSGC